MGKRTYYPKNKKPDKLTTKERLDLTFDLISALSIVKSPLETSLLIQDLLTAAEIKNLSKRLRIAKLLINGESHRDIAEKVKCSTSTVTKVNAWLSHGGEGLRNVIKKLPKRYSYPKRLPKIPIEFQLPRVLMFVAQHSLAKKQENKIKDLEKFWEKVEDKKLLDKQLKELFSEYYKDIKTKRSAN